jgi:hypothetical protein
MHGRGNKREEKKQLPWLRRLLISLEIDDTEACLNIELI